MFGFVFNVLMTNLSISMFVSPVMSCLLVKCKACPLGQSCDFKKLKVYETIPTQIFLPPITQNSYLKCKKFMNCKRPKPAHPRTVLKGENFITVNSAHKFSSEGSAKTINPNKH